MGKNICAENQTLRGLKSGGTIQWHTENKKAPLSLTTRAILLQTSRSLNRKIHG